MKKLVGIIVGMVMTFAVFAQRHRFADTTLHLDQEELSIKFAKDASLSLYTDVLEEKDGMSVIISEVGNKVSNPFALKCKEIINPHFVSYELVNDSYDNYYIITDYDNCTRNLEITRDKMTFVFDNYRLDRNGNVDGEVVYEIEEQRIDIFNEEVQESLAYVRQIVKYVSFYNNQTNLCRKIQYLCSPSKGGKFSVINEEDYLNAWNKFMNK